MNGNTNTYDLKYTLKDSSESIFLSDLGDNRGLNIIFYEEGKRYFLSIVNGNIIKNEFSSIVSSFCDASSSFMNNEIESLNSNGFVDIDGDCLNDILITSIKDGKRYLEIWKGIFEDKRIKYCLTSNNVYPLDDNLGLFTIVDVDRNGMPDLVFPILNSSPPQIMLAHNRINLDYDWTENYCDNHEALSIDSSNKENIKLNTFYDIPKIGSSTDFTSFINLSNSNEYSFYSDDDFPVYLKFGDINQDAYPDLAVLLKNKNINEIFPYVFISQSKSVENNHNGKLRRNFYINDVYSFNKTDANSISFFDFKDDSKLDIMISDKNGKLYGYYNHNVYDTYTMKSILLYKEDCFNCLAIGSTQRFITTNIDGSRRMDLSIQSPQPGVKGGLSMPFAYLGIGRSNNYIEHFHTISGMEYERKCNDKTYTPVIPNSQLVIYSLKEGKDCSWKVSLIVKPTEKLALLIFVVILMIVIMSAYVTWLQMKEVQEDNLENKELFAPWFG
ncbi:MAG: hypothetical protein MJ252_15130 [archaeon]|nr:hypothetical protein [archaeon]